MIKARQGASAEEDDSKKKIHYEQLKHMGNFRHNMKVLEEGKGTIIVARRSKTDHLPADYLPCTHCYGFYIASELWRHARTCSLNKVSKNKQTEQASVISQSRLLLAGASEKENEMGSQQFKDLVNRMKKYDDVCIAVKQDFLIERFGTVLVTKLGGRRKNDISQRVRQLGRLKCELGLSSTAQLSDLISGPGFDTILEGVHSLCNLYENKQRIKVFEVPSLALRLGHSLIKCAEIKKGLGIRQKNQQMKLDAEDFISLHSGDWTDSVSSIALATLRTAHFNKIDFIPLTGDIVKLTQFLEAETKRLTDHLQRLIEQDIDEQDIDEQDKDEQEESHINSVYQTWRQLCETTAALVTIFNKRRASEVVELLVQSYQERPKWTEKSNAEMFETLDEVERKLLERMDMVESQGKMDKRIKILLTKDMVAAIDGLIKHREAAGILNENILVFANQGKGHINIWEVLQTMAKAAKCTEPKRMTATRIRKYIATVCQVSLYILTMCAMLAVLYIYSTYIALYIQVSPHATYM